MSCPSAILLQMDTTLDDLSTVGSQRDESPGTFRLFHAKLREYASRSGFSTDDSSSGDSLSAVFAESLIRLSKFRELRPNWNSYGAVPVTEDAITAAKDLFASLQSIFQGLTGCCWDDQRCCALAPVATVPLDDGGVGIEWSLPGMEIEISIGPGRKMEYLAVEGSGESRKYTERDAVSKNEVLQLFLRAFAN